MAAAHGRHLALIHHFYKTCKLLAQVPLLRLPTRTQQLVEARQVVDSVEQHGLAFKLLVLVVLFHRMPNILRIRGALLRVYDCRLSQTYAEEVKELLGQRVGQKAQLLQAIQDQALDARQTRLLAHRDTVIDGVAEYLFQARGELIHHGHLAKEKVVLRADTDAFDRDLLIDVSEK